MPLEDCMGRITHPLMGCENCVKDELNLRCPCYEPHQKVDLVDIGEDPEDIYGEQGYTLGRDK
jgi:hypothetical protein